MHNDGSVSAAEIARFSALAPQWWDPNGPMRELHRMNPLRTAWIATRIGPAPRTVLDLGCGAGLATEALARAGYTMTGVDGSPEAIAFARTHAAEAGLSITYRTGLAQDMLAEHPRFDAVTALEIIEHVPDQAAFVATLAALLKPGGLLFVSTLNRTWRSLAIAKVGAEYIAGLLPRGTHDWKRFVKPEELAALARAAGLHLSDLSGMRRDTLTGQWRLAEDTAMNYIAAFAAAE